MSMSLSGRPSFLLRVENGEFVGYGGVNVLKRTTFISTLRKYERLIDKARHVSMSLSGRPSFLRFPLGTRINKGFWVLFLQVIV